ncbi:MAG: GHMP kinase [Kiritimatiellae bacterium]|nr:GHMP kinase [Kiritimatiellia bacterium]
MIITEKAYPRAGLVGNPSDGFFGKTIALAFSNFSARITLFESPEIDLVPSMRDHSHFGSIHKLVDDVRLYGYYGGIRLLKSAVKRFHQYCNEAGCHLDDRNFTIRYDSDIPHLVGLGGSSAIITACVRALMTFYGVEIPKQILANLVLAVEKDELGISAGLQDRVIQAYQGLVYMDFDKAAMDRDGYGRYEELDSASLPPLFIAYRADLSEGSDVVHNDLTRRFHKNDNEVLEAIAFWADLTGKVRDDLASGNGSGIGQYLDANFDRRASLCGIGEGNRAMIEIARELGCSAKFTGSGGAIIGTYEDENIFPELEKRMLSANVKVIKPTIASPREGQ